MARTLDDARRWMAEGTKLMSESVASLGEAGFTEPSLLPGWTRKHVVAHVAANADAIGNLVHWAATGVETPMYRSPEERAAGIANGAAMSSTALESWLATAAEALDEAMARLTLEQWQCQVVTAQGRTVRASETPWMRAREVCVHAVDLGNGSTFADLPADFNAALCEDIRTKRGMTDMPARIAEAPLPDMTAWLAGRPHALRDVPELGPWL